MVSRSPQLFTSWQDDVGWHPEKLVAQMQDFMQMELDSLQAMMEDSDIGHQLQEITDNMVALFKPPQPDALARRRLLRVDTAETANAAEKPGPLHADRWGTERPTLELLTLGTLLETEQQTKNNVPVEGGEQDALNTDNSYLLSTLVDDPEAYEDMAISELMKLQPRGSGPDYAPPQGLAQLLAQMEMMAMMLDDLVYGGSGGISPIQADFIVFDFVPDVVYELEVTADKKPSLPEVPGGDTKHMTPADVEPAGL